MFCWKGVWVDGEEVWVDEGWMRGGWGVWMYGGVGELRCVGGWMMDG